MQCVPECNALGRKTFVELLDRHSIAIVGARRPTPYGNQMAERLGRDLADRGLVVVSGLARGIESLRA